MSTITPPSPEMTAEYLSRENTPVFVNKSGQGDTVDIPPLRGDPLLKETTPGRTLRPNEALPFTQPLVLVRGVEHGKEIVLPGYYACVGTMPCAETEYYLLVRWEHREGGRRGERRVVLPEHIRVMDRDTLLLPPPAAAPIMPVPPPGLSGVSPDNLLHPTLEFIANTPDVEPSNNERYPQLQHSAKRKS